VFDDNLTGMTGMEAPALDGGNAPVVRYQDLHRASSPASAGAPALDTQRSYAPEVIEAAEEISEIGYSPLEVPDYVAPYYGAAQGGYGVSGMTYADVQRLPRLAKGSSDRGNVALLQSALVSKGYMTEGDAKTGPGVFGDKTERAVKAAQRINFLPDTGVVDTETWAALYGVTTPSEDALTRAGEAESKRDTAKTPATKTQRGAVASGTGSFLDSFNISLGFKPDPKQKFEVSNQDTKALGEGPDWGKIALWGGVAVAGIAVTVLVVRAVSSKE